MRMEDLLAIVLSVLFFLFKYYRFHESAIGREVVINNKTTIMVINNRIIAIILHIIKETM